MHLLLTAHHNYVLCAFCLQPILYVLYAFCLQPIICVVCFLFTAHHKCSVVFLQPIICIVCSTWQKAQQVYDKARQLLVHHIEPTRLSYNPRGRHLPQSLANSWWRQGVCSRGETVIVTSINDYKVASE